MHVNKWTVVSQVYESEYEDATTKARIRLACKIVDASEASKNFLTKFFPREMEIMSKVNHANIIRVHSILMRKETYFIFMEFAAHGDLLEFIKAHGAVKELRAKIWFGQILQGGKKNFSKFSPSFLVIILSIYLRLN